MKYVIEYFRYLRYINVSIFLIYTHYYIYDATSNEIFMLIYNIGKPKIGCFAKFFPCYRRFCIWFCPTVP